MIKKWEAKLVTGWQDILEEYNISKKSIFSSEKNITFEKDLDKKIYSLLILELLSPDKIAEKLNINISSVSTRLSMMEINKIIRKQEWWKYEIIS